MSKALVFEGKVIQIEEEEFPVHKNLKWIDIGVQDVKPQDDHNGTTFSRPVPKPAVETAMEKLERRVKQLEDAK